MPNLINELHEARYEINNNLLNIAWMSILLDP